MPAQENGSATIAMENGKVGDSANEEMDTVNGGHDNPAFVENEVETAGSSSPSSNRLRVDGDNVEMVPLNPTAGEDHSPSSGATAPASTNTSKNNYNNNNNGSPATTTMTTTSKQNDKAALDNMYSEYFRPVNTRRKLLRGEKLYVTRDQRAHSRSWKWIAFWGGVFTFLAAALLAGILAATGIIMSHSEPLFGTSNSLVASNNSEWNDTAATAASSSSLATHGFIAATTTMNPDMNHVINEFDNSLDENNNNKNRDEEKNAWPQSTELQPLQSTTTTVDPIVHWLTTASTDNELLTTEQRVASTTTPMATTSVNDRGRSLDKEVPIFVPPFGDQSETTLFPVLTDGNADVEDATTVPAPEWAFDPNGHPTALFPTLKPEESSDDAIASLLPTQSANDTWLLQAENATLYDVLTSTQAANDSLGDVDSAAAAANDDNVTEWLRAATERPIFDVALSAFNLSLAENTTTLNTTTADWIDGSNVTLEDTSEKGINSTNAVEGLGHVANVSSSEEFAVDNSTMMSANETTTPSTVNATSQTIVGAFLNETTTPTPYVSNVTTFALDTANATLAVDVASASLNETSWDVATSNSTLMAGDVDLERNMSTDGNIINATMTTAPTSSNNEMSTTIAAAVNTSTTVEALNLTATDDSWTVANLTSDVLATSLNETTVTTPTHLNAITEVDFKSHNHTTSDVTEL